MTDITTRLLDMSEAMYMDRDQDELDALLLEAKQEIERIRKDAYCDTDKAPMLWKDICQAAFDEIEHLRRVRLKKAFAKIEAIEGAAKAVIAQWDTPNWKLTEPTAKLIESLRAVVSSEKPAVPAPKPFAFKDPSAQREWERQRKERGE
ncbi:hypothetical protein EVC28_031 [Rhizobium phage RHph_I1_23]|nr:hypothetical protein EVC28_031 [Rhizobium phage RHph_I1_23]